MQIRSRLTFQFIAMVSIIVLVTFGIIYYSSAQYRKNEFYQRLENKARTSAEIFVSVEQIDSTMLRIFDSRQKDKLPLENISIYNHENHELYTNNDSLSFDANKKILDEVRLNGRKEFTDGEFEILGITYTDRFNRFVVFAGAVDFYGVSKLRNLRNTLFILFIVTISILALSGWIFAGRALKPLNNIVNEVRGLSVDRLDIRLKKGRYNDEIGKLIDTFNTLLGRIENAFSLQRLFVTGASHELKNPLTSITSQLQVILLRDRSNEEYKKLISSILDDILALNRRTMDLMEYAKLSYENKVPLANVRVDDVLWTCRDYFSKTNPEYKVQINMEQLPEDENKLIIAGNGPLLQVAFINLIDNACKFSTDKTCKIDLKAGEGSVSICFRDEGSGIERGELDLIFEPFYRSDVTAGSKGHGIGLALTRKIIQLHHSSISVSSEKNEGTVFSIRFLSKK